MSNLVNHLTTQSPANTAKKHIDYSKLLQKLAAPASVATSLLSVGAAYHFGLLDEFAIGVATIGFYALSERANAATKTASKGDK